MKWDILTTVRVGEQIYKEGWPSLTGKMNIYGTIGNCVYSTHLDWCWDGQTMTVPGSRKLRCCFFAPLLLLVVAKVVGSSWWVNSPCDIGNVPFSGWCLGHPSEKYESQLGWWNSQYMGKYKMATKPPTSFCLHPLILVAPICISKEHQKQKHKRNIYRDADKQDEFR